MQLGPEYWRRALIRIVRYSVVQGWVRGGGVELDADEGGELGREEDRDGIEPQACVQPRRFPPTGIGTRRTKADTALTGSPMRPTPT